MIVIPLPFRGRFSPRIGIALAVVGGLLIVLEGLQFVGGSGPPYALAGLAVGGSIVGLAILADSAGRHRPFFGGAVVLLSVLSLFGLSGYLLGALLGSLGGTLVVLSPGFSSERYRARPGLSATDLGPPCPSCGKRVPPWTSTCPYCGS